METAKKTHQSKPFNGLVPLCIIFIILLGSPLFYFIINLMLGNEHLFNGIIMN
ncbi:hypothetical protein PAESOLCIP111_00406 [Paenibacillus solanacearum]|uniref:Uncharacterized protein n=1 Tax=Paenibacillus solanacearum TaxID=2048548 RepID=A0A916NF94_9BACL|nr:hypothetical protein [Paenibacillus solanacearum]CAG7600544.1 hypothetical protein PAESOLCIP111_00406 [Paenibacillus solanacearum]